MGISFIWSLTSNGLLDLISYNKTCPVEVPTPIFKGPSNFIAVIEGKLSFLKGRRMTEEDIKLLQTYLNLED